MQQCSFALRSPALEEAGRTLPVFPSIQGEASDSWKPFTCQFGMSLRKLNQAQRIASCRRRFW